MLSQESKLYTNIPVAEKYAILESMRLDLVPHEDTDCRTMRLVYRTAHTAFKHRGGVANALNIKSHFSNN